MSRRRPCLLALVLTTACAGGDNTPTTSAAPSTQATAPASTVTTLSRIEGVQTFAAEAGHAEGALTYPQTPPVGGIHNPIWQACTFYDAPVPNEKAVHSLEHGAIWITYRPDLAPTEIQLVSALARARKDVLASRWDSGLPAPLVATAWGRQLRLESATDPRLTEFVRLYANQGPEINAPC